MNSIRSFGSESNPVPVIDSVAPGFAMAGLNDVMEGRADDDVTVNGALLVAVPLGEVTEIGPVVAVAGTVTTNWLDEAEVTVPVPPVNVTESCDALLLNAVPEIVTDVPTGPLTGVKPRIETWPTEERVMLVMFPTASYEYAAEIGRAHV